VRLGKRLVPQSLQSYDDYIAKLPLCRRALAGQTGAFLQPAVPFVIHALASGGAFTLGLAGAQVTLVQLLFSRLFILQSSFART
jgi:hypothetical protein